MNCYWVALRASDYMPMGAKFRVAGPPNAGEDLYLSTFARSMMNPEGVALLDRTGADYILVVHAVDEVGAFAKTLVWREAYLTGLGREV